MTFDFFLIFCFDGGCAAGAQLAKYVEHVVTRRPHHEHVTYTFLTLSISHHTLTLRNPCLPPRTSPSRMAPYLINSSRHIRARATQIQACINPSVRVFSQPSTFSKRYGIVGLLRVFTNSYFLFLLFPSNKPAIFVNCENGCSIGEGGCILCFFDPHHKI